MSISDEIDKAISAHGSWKRKLKGIIDTGECDVTVEHVRADNNCSFGKWLHERIDASTKASPFYKQALDNHAKFHIAASDILALALAGKTDEATEKMGFQSEFAKISAALTKTLMDWKASL